MGKAKPKYELPPGRLWPNTPSGAPLAIEVFGATGPYASGKTLLGLSIAPGNHPEGHAFAGKARTLYLDFEKSGGTYGGTGCCRIDVPTKLLELKGDNYKPADVAIWFVDLLTNKLKPGQFDAIVADPITDVESGIVDWVKANPSVFGYTDTQFAKGGGLLWGAVKDYWKQLLLKISTKCQTFYFTSHLRQVFEGATPVRGKKEPKGKDTLMELSSLYLWLERTANKDGVVPQVPTGTVLKQRLSDTLMTDEGELQIVPLMPPRIESASVQSIRGYVANPPNYSKLKPNERVIEREMTDEERLQYQLSIAEAEQSTTENRVALLARQEELKRLSLQQAASRPQSSDQTAKVQQQKAQKEKANADQAEADRLKAEAETKIAEAQKEGAKLVAGGDDANANKPTESQVQSAKILFGKVGASRDSFMARCGGKVFAGLQTVEANAVLAWLIKLEQVKDLGETICRHKKLSAEAWDRILKEKILAKVGASTVDKLNDENLNNLIAVLTNEKAKSQPAEESPQGN